MIIIQEAVAIISARFYFSVKFHETLLAKNESVEKTPLVKRGEK